MRMYHTPGWLQKLYSPRALWRVKTHDKKLYLTFDDGPTDEVTDWILDTLIQFQARATFFCVGENVVRRQGQYQKLLHAGHAIGNHTQNHLNGWKTSTDVYAENTAEAAEHINSKLFRPPYGRMTKGQIKLMDELGYKTVFWTVLTYDFDKNLDREEAWKSIIKHTGPGSILVFHDHEKAFENLKALLPRTLEYYSKAGYTFEVLS